MFPFTATCAVYFCSCVYVNGILLVCMCLDMSRHPEGVYMPAWDCQTSVNKLCAWVCAVWYSMLSFVFGVNVCMVHLCTCVSGRQQQSPWQSLSISLCHSCSSMYLKDRSSLTLHHSQTEPLKEAN